MKVKQFTAPDMTQAMARIREELGEEAIILSTDNVNEGVRVTVAIENVQEVNFDKNEKLEVSPSLQVYDDVKIRESLEYHDILPDIAGQILARARQQYQSRKSGDNQKLLAEALAKMIGFGSLWNKKQKNKIFFGIPGSGKSTVIAKVATQAKIRKQKTLIISTDFVRAGANKQLEAFSKILQTDFQSCKNARELFKTVHNNQEQYDLILIDTPGINPYKEEQITRTDELIDSLKSDKILVQDAGRNTLETVETGDLFKRLGVEFLLPTHLDMTRRIGSFVSSAYCNHLKLCAGSISSDIAKGLADMTPEALARLLLTE